MSNEFTPKVSLSQGMFSSFNLRSKEIKEKGNMDAGTSYEVFRNNTTAVEVIVKDVGHIKKKGNLEQLMEMRRLQDEVESLRSELHKPTNMTQNLEFKKKLEKDVEILRTELGKAKLMLGKTKKGFTIIVQELRKQLDVANQREIDEQSKNVMLQLEIEKLRTLLDSKSNLVSKLKGELDNLKRALKFVIKSIMCAPKIPEMVHSEVDYDDFEDNLNRHDKVEANSNNMFIGTATFDSTISKYTNNSFEKRCL